MSRMICPHCGGWIYLENPRNGSCDTCNSKLVDARLIIKDSNPDEDRAITLLRAAKALLLKQREADILINNPLTAHYDDADCDGYCLIDDIQAYLADIERACSDIQM